MRTQAFVGEKLEAGTIVEIRESRGSNRSRMIMIECRHCKRIGSGGRYSVAKKGLRKSCNCLRNAIFRDREMAKVRDLGPKERIRIFDIAAKHGRSGRYLAAIEAGVSAYTVGFTWLTECRRLDALPFKFRKMVYIEARRNGQRMSDLMAHFGLTKHQILRICFVMRRNLLLDVERATDLGLACPPHSQLSADLLDNINLHIDQARAVLNKRSNRVARHLRRELSPKELQVVKRNSRYGWLFQVLKNLDRSQVFALFGEEGLWFLDTCHRTLKQRQGRRQKFLEKLKEDQQRSCSIPEPVEFKPRSQWPRLSSRGPARPNMPALMVPGHSEVFIELSLGFRADLSA